MFSRNIVLRKVPVSKESNGDGHKGPWENYSFLENGGKRSNCQGKNLSIKVRQSRALRSRSTL